MEERFLWN